MNLMLFTGLNKQNLSLVLFIELQFKNIDTSSMLYIEINVNDKSSGLQS